MGVLVNLILPVWVIGIITIIEIMIVANSNRNNSNSNSNST